MEKMKAVLVLFPFIGFFEKVVTKLFPGQDVTIQKNAMHLDQRLLQTPTMALEGVKKELGRMTRITHTMLDLEYERFEKKTSKSGKFFFVLQSGNHQVIGQSEMYNSESGRNNGIESVKKNGTVDRVEVL